MRGEGSRCLQALAPVNVCAGTVEKVHADFEDFFLQVAVCSQTQAAERALGWGSARSWMQGWENTRELPGAVGATWTTQSHHHRKFCLLQEVLQDQVPRSQNPWKFLKCRFQGPDLLGQQRKASQGYHICDNTGGLGLLPLSGNSGHWRTELAWTQQRGLLGTKASDPGLNVTETSRRL